MPLALSLSTNSAISPSPCSNAFPDFPWASHGWAAFDAIDDYPNLPLGWQRIHQFLAGLQPKFNNRPPLANRTKPLACRSARIVARSAMSSQCVRKPIISRAVAGWESSRGRR